MTLYRTIVADPPWDYREGLPITRIPQGAVHDGRRTPLPYSWLSVEQIAALPVGKFADPSGCHLYLWTTNRYLLDAFGIVKAWGFRYSQLLTWAKKPQGIGPGGTFSQNAEFILFARRGKLRHLRRHDSVWFNWPRTAVHSKKPDHFQDLVEQISPGPYLELFARRQRLGWDTWGNEAFNHVDLEVTV